MSLSYMASSQTTGKQGTRYPSNGRRDNTAIPISETTP
jgi:hypothetical protein